MTTDWRKRDGHGGGIKQRRELAGMVAGILADDEIKVLELVHLSTWLRDNLSALGEGFFWLLELMDDVLADGRVDDAEEEALRHAMGETLDICQREEPEPASTDAFEQQLVGFLKGVTSDQGLNDRELAALSSLMRSTTNGGVLADVVREVVDRYSDDRIKLWEALCAVAGHDPGSGIVGGLSIGEIFDDGDADLSPEEASFCLTGTFQYGSRSKCVARLNDVGGVFHSSLKKDTDFLVIGTLETRAWIGTSYGRKIEHALERRQKYGKPRIVSEARWDAMARRIEERKKRSAEIDVDRYFERWVFQPNRAQRPALNVELRERMDRERTNRAREAAKSRGETAEDVRRIKVLRKAWVVGRPPSYDFHVGDLFTAEDGSYVQVAYDSEPLEVHSNQSGQWLPYSMRARDLAHWLRSGVEPVDCRIEPSQCHSELHRFLLRS